MPDTAEAAMIAAKLDPDNWRTYPPGMLRTLSGKVVDLRQFRPSMVDINDIADALGHLRRFSGHATPPITVLQHSLHVANDVRYGTAPALTNLSGIAAMIELAALLHDAHEAYIGDITTPVAAVLDPVIVNGLKARIQGPIHDALDLPWPLPRTWQDAIKAADRRALDYEWRSGLVEHRSAYPPVTSAMFVARVLRLWERAR